MNLELTETDTITPRHWFAIRRDGLSFLQCCAAAIDQRELLAQIDRLYGSNLLRRGAPIELAIDDATGRAKHDMETFSKFVWNFIFTRVPLTDTQTTP